MKMIQDASLGFGGALGFGAILGEEVVAVGWFGVLLGCNLGTQRVFISDDSESGFAKPQQFS